jgi:hypothetical protein
MEEIFRVIFGNADVSMAIIPLIAAGLLVAGAGMGMSSVKGQQRKNKLSEMKAEQDRQSDANMAWWRATQSDDYLNSVQAQKMLKQQRDSLDRERKITANSAAITGATQGLIAANKAAATQSLSNTMSNIAALGEQKKQQETNIYLNRDAQIKQNQSNIEGKEMDLIKDQQAQADNITQSGLSLASGAAGKMK